MSRIEVRTFDGDLDTLRRLASQSWSKEYPGGSWPDLFSPALAAHYFEHLPDPRFLVGAYLKGELIGFLANLPRTYRLRGQQYLGIISCMLTVHPAQPGALGLLLSECMQRNRLLEADFALFTLELSHKLIRLFEMLNTRHPTQRLLSMHPLVRGIDFPAIRSHERLRKLEVAAIRLLGAHGILPPIATGSMAREYRTDDLPGVLALMDGIPDNRQLVRVYDDAGLQGRFSNPSIGGMVVSARSDEILGFLSFSKYGMVNPRGSHPWAWIDLVCWDRLSALEKQDLLAAAWHLSQAQGCIGIMQWTKQAISHAPFYRAHYIPYPRALDIQVWYLKAGLVLSGVRGLFEQMI